MKILRLVFLILFMKHIGCQYIDPHDMNTNAKEKYMKPTLTKSFSTSSLNNDATNINSEICFSHLKRMVSVLINSAHIDKRDPEIYYGHLHFNIDPDDMDFLTKFGKEDLTLDKLRKLDTFFSESFKKSAINGYLDQIESFQLKLYSLVLNSNNLWLLGSVCLLYVVYQLFKNNFSFSYVIRYLLILILIFDFGMRYHKLLEEAEEHNASITYSSKCDPAKMTWSEWTKFWFSNKDCERQTVTPLDAVLYQVKNLIIVPMHAFGTGMGGFGYNMFTTLPWVLNVIMWPFMLIFCLILTVFAMVILTGQPIEFNIFHLFKLKFGGFRPIQNENVVTVERLMEHLHRPMVQNITVSVPGGNNRESQAAENNSAQAIENRPDYVTSDGKDESVPSENTVGHTDKNKENTKCEGKDISCVKSELEILNGKGESVSSGNTVTPTDKHKENTNCNGNDE